MTEDYIIETRPLPVEDGGGFLAWAPDLPGCMSDGESRDEAEAGCRDAVREWLDRARREGIEVPPAAGRHAVA